MNSAASTRSVDGLGEPGEALPQPRRLPLVEQYLREQQQLTAVERFAKQHHGDDDGPRRYEALLPATPPGPGQQYAFHVDLDVCSGCKACVTACHNLNGLDEGETWRAVGLLHGGTATAPVKQSVTTACHHCLDPACMNGCPVGAYEKDALTGIVSHLDDQCIGCQYCTFTCPYEVPQYNAERGIVRKCDMCKDRLAVGEAPACVQACPNEAIAITIVERRQALEDAQGDAFLPGAPSPAITVPTTIYSTERALPRNMLPANFYAVRPSHQHTPLVIMLVLTQLSVGAFWLDAVARRLDRELVARLGPTHTLVAVAVGLAALGASVAHLGRPLYAFRALIGLRTSWMSREILAFGLFAPLAIAYAAAPLWSGPLASAASPALAARVQEGLRDLVVLTGLAGIVCSVLIYHVTRRAWWNASRTAFKFLATAVVLGLATTVLTFSLEDLHGAGGDASHLSTMTSALSRALVGASAAKLVVELSFLRHLRDKRYGELRRTAHLMTRDLLRYTQARFALLAVGGVLLPLVNGGSPTSAWIAAVSFVLLVAGELFERTLFFAASSSPGMPGGVG